MPVVTILSHGTANSTNTNTSEGHVLVITQIARMLAGTEGVDWMLNQGAGTQELRRTGIRSGSVAGVARGLGVEANVDRSVAWVKNLLPNVTAVNLAGHSRGSITCYKIARALHDDRDTTHIPVNVFAIDPVPGNTGTMNKQNYENISLGQNVAHSFLMLAESEHRLVFRPFIDALYSVGLPQHKVDTMPGTHAGLNMLGGEQEDAARLVLSRALEFLHAHQTPINGYGDPAFVLPPEKRLEKYSTIMSRLGVYKAAASVNPLRGPLNFAMSGFQVERHRIVNVYGPKDAWGKQKASTTVTDERADTRRRKDYHGLNMSTALQRIDQGGDGSQAHAVRPHRFFANLEHQDLFRQSYSNLYEAVRSLERAGQDKRRITNEIAEGWDDYRRMPEAVKRHFEKFLTKRGIW